MAPHGKELSEDLRIIIVALHKDGLGYKKFSNSLELSYSTVARVIQRFSKTGKEVESLCCVSGAEAGFKKQTHKCCQHCFRGRRSGRSAWQCSDHTSHTATSQFAWPLFQKEASSEAGSQKACKQFVEDDLAKSMNYWNRVLWSDESKVNLFGSDGVQHVWWCPGEEYQENCALLTVNHGGGSIMVWGCMSAAGTGELRFIEGNMDSNTYWDCDDALPSETVFQHNHPKHTAKMTLPCWWSWRWRSGQVCLQTWTLMIILKQKMEKHHVSNNRYVSVEEWKRTPATACAALVNSMPRRIKAVLGNNGAPTKYWHFGHSFDVFT